MIFNINSSFLDAIVLNIVSNEDTYGYKITQEVKKFLEISESTLYPVLRRLQKENFLETYDSEYCGRNRRYYKITSNGIIQLDGYRHEWKKYINQMNEFFFGQTGELQDE